MNLSPTTLSVLSELRALAAKQRDARDAEIASPSDPSRFAELDGIYEETLRQIRVLAAGGEI